jgi:hypothetical protein
MPTLDQHQSSQYTKVLYIGDSSSGKTGSLVSLLAAGYTFRILDMDNGLDSLVAFARKEGLDLSKVEFETIRDKYKAGKTGPKIDGTPKAFIQAMETMTEWSEHDDPKCIFVLDSLSALGRAAFAWANALNPTVKDKRQVFGAAQGAIEDCIALISGETFRMNAIVISHVNYQEADDGTTKGFTNAIGKALGPVIPRYFNTLLLAETTGSGKNVKRKIKTVPTHTIDLKTPVPDIDAEFPLPTGMAEIFRLLRGE